MSDNKSEAKDKKKELKLDDLPGVGDATKSKLKSAGITSIRALALYPISKLQDEVGIGEKTSIKIVKAAQEIEKMGFKSAELIWEKRRDLKRITTGSNNLDELFGGGLETGAVIELFGEYRTGKTQIAHQLCVNSQLPYESGGLEGAALYVDTEGTFRPERIINMSEGLDLDYGEVLKNIVVGRAYNSDHQVLLIKESPKIIEEKNIKVVIVDSIITHFRSEYVGRGTLATRQQLLNSHIHDLLRLSETFEELCVLFTNQVSAKPDVFYGNPLTHTGGNIIAHGSTIRVYLRKGKGEQRVAKIIDAPHLPESDAVFTITDDGIRD
ncbi:MAG: DNA repair and recombination protein RadA [Candidatus Lokiarchaeota archaeon]|nr:DNA repair and recombination protein RadA [Candidatus Lokiarchaeota archaeon]MBD3200554.1 DNA repair and recombination protein RadA [Candidatus Lokiarchaeota archaeon]